MAGIGLADCIFEIFRAITVFMNIHIIMILILKVLKKVMILLMQEKEMIKYIVILEMIHIYINWGMDMMLSLMKTEKI